MPVRASGRGLLDTNILILRRWIDARAAGAIAEDLPLFTTNPDDFEGLTGLVTVVPVSRPPGRREGR